MVHTCCDRQRNDTGCVVEEVELLVRWLAASIVWCALYLCVLHTDRSRHSLCNCEMITNQSDSEQKFDTTHRVRCWLRLPRDYIFSPVHLRLGHVSIMSELAELRVATGCTQDLMHRTRHLTQPIFGRY